MGAIMLNLRNGANEMLGPGALGHFILSAIAAIGNLSAIEVAMIAPGSFFFFRIDPSDPCVYMETVLIHQTSIFET